MTIHLFISRHFLLISRLMLALTLITVLVLSLMPVEQIPLSNWNDKFQHWLAFIVISGLVDASWPESRFDWKKILFITAYGALIELLQSLTSYREMSAADLFTDIAGALSYILMIPVWKKVPVVRLRWALLSNTSDRTG